MTTSTLLAMWLHKSTVARTLTFNFKLKLPKDYLADMGVTLVPVFLASVYNQAWVYNLVFFSVFFFSHFLEELKNFAEFFLILLIMFCTKQSHCLTQLFKNVKLTLYSKRWYICVLDLPEKLYSLPFFFKIPCNVYIFN